MVAEYAYKSGRVNSETRRRSTVLKRRFCYHSLLTAFVRKSIGCVALAMNSRPTRLVLLSATRRDASLHEEVVAVAEARQDMGRR